MYLLPLMAGLLVTSIGSGQIISKTGKYRFFPIAGTALMTLGLYLLSLMGVGSSYTLQDAVYMLECARLAGRYPRRRSLVTGRTVLVIIDAELACHTANSAARDLELPVPGAIACSIGGSFGTAIFGDDQANVLIGNLARHLHGVTLPQGFSAADATPALLAQLPAAVHQGFVKCCKYTHAESIQTLFVVAVPIAALAFLANWLIPQVELKRWPEASAAAPEADIKWQVVAWRPGWPRGGDAGIQQTTPASPVTHEALDPQDAGRTEP